MKRVLLTGVAGFAGSHALRGMLNSTDWHVVGTLSYDHKGHPQRAESAAKGFEASRYTFIPVDLRRPLTTATRLAIGNVDAIVNYAALSDVFQSIQEPRLYAENNVQVMETVLELARSLPNLGHLIQISTDEVYGPCHGEPHKEWSPIIPSNPYSASKAAMEAQCIAAWRTYGTPLIITNTMNLVGELQGDEKYLPMLIKKIKAGETVTIHASPEGKIGSRFYVSARNLADAAVFLINKGEPDRFGQAQVPERYNIVGDREIDNLELAQTVAGILGKPLHYELVDWTTSRPGHDLRYALNGDKLAALGWERPVSLDTTLKHIVEWETLDDGRTAG